MPLQKAINLDNGIQLSAAYMIITKLEIKYASSEVNLVVSIFKDSSAYSANKPEVLNYNHQCSGTDFTTYFAESVLALVNNTPLTKGYEWLLTLPLYDGAIVV